MSDKKILGLIGLAEKAGKTASGEFAAEWALKEGKAKLLILAEDASDNTKKKFLEQCGRAKCPGLVFGTKDSIGHAIGKAERACIVIQDEGLAGAIRQAAERLNGDQGE